MPSSEIAPKYASLNDVAAIAGVSKWTVRRRVADGTLPAVRVGRLIRVDLNEVDALMRPIPTAGNAA